MVSITLLSPSGESVPIPFPRPKPTKDREDSVTMPPPKMNIVVPYSGKYDRTKDLEDVVPEPLIHDIDEFLKSVSLCDHCLDTFPLFNDLRGLKNALCTLSEECQRLHQYQARYWPE